MKTGPQRFIALLLLLSPWIYVPTAFKEVLMIVLGVSLFLITIDLRKKRREDLYETKTSSFVESRPLV